MNPDKLNHLETNIFIIFYYTIILLPLGILLSKLTKFLKVRKYCKKCFKFFDLKFDEFINRIYIYGSPFSFKHLIKFILLDIGYYFSYKYCITEDLTVYNEYYK